MRKMLSNFFRALYKEHIGGLIFTIILTLLWTKIFILIFNIGGAISLGFLIGYGMAMYIHKRYCCIYEKITKGGSFVE